MKKSYDEFYNEIIEVNKLYHEEKVQFDIDNNEQIYQILSHHFVQRKIQRKTIKNFDIKSIYKISKNFENYHQR